MLDTGHHAGATVPTCQTRDPKLEVTSHGLPHFWLFFFHLNLTRHFGICVTSVDCRFSSFCSQSCPELIAATCHFLSNGDDLLITFDFCKSIFGIHFQKCDLLVKAQHGQQGLDCTGHDKNSHGWVHPWPSCSAGHQSLPTLPGWQAGQ